MQEKLSSQLDEYKQSRNNFPKDSDGIYFLLDGSITVKNNFNTNDADCTGKEPPHELYPKQEKTTTTTRHNNVKKESDKPE
jgi:hypothetical protein